MRDGGLGVWRGILWGSCSMVVGTGRSGVVALKREWVVLWNFLVEHKLDLWALRWPLIVVASDFGGYFLTCVDVNPGNVVR